MDKVKAWLGAARLRTLPLSVSGIILGTALANLAGYSDSLIFSLAILTTICFQITSNFANDYGDGVKGTDSNDRIGPQRAIQSGALSTKELFAGIVVISVISFILTVYLVYIAFGLDSIAYFLLFIGLGAFSIWAALKYTMGSSPYGYQGLGDLFVFMFFGLVAVLGTKFLYVKTIDPIDILPAITIGLLCVGVLNLNNLRDSVSDKKHGKHTLVVKMGFENGKKYHYALLILSFLLMSLFIWMQGKPFLMVTLLLFIPIFVHLFKVVKTTQPKDLDPELKKLALSTFALALVFYFAVNNFL